MLQRLFFHKGKKPQHKQAYFLFSGSRGSTGERTYIAKTYGHDGQDAYFYASLFAAAPDLLHALQAAVEAGTTLHRGGHISLEWLEEAREALDRIPYKEPKT